MVGISNEKRISAAKRRHGGEHSHARHHPQCCHEVGEPADARGRNLLLAVAGAIRRVDQPQRERQIDEAVDDEPIARPQDEKDRPAYGRSGEQSQITRCRHKPHCTGQVAGSDDIVDQHLRGRIPKQGSNAMHSEHSMKSTMPIWMMRRGSKRSESAPTHTPNTRNGTQWEMTANPPSAGEYGKEEDARFRDQNL